MHSTPVIGHVYRQGDMAGTTEVLGLRHRTNDSPELHPWRGLLNKLGNISAKYEDIAHQNVGRIGLNVVSVEMVEYKEPLMGIEVSGNLDYDSVAQWYSAALWLSPETLGNIHATTDKHTYKAFVEGLTDRDLKSPEGHFSAESWAFCIIKPDAKNFGIETDIKDLIGENGLTVKAEIGGVELGDTDLDQIWPAPLDADGNPKPPSPWWQATVDYMQSGPVDLLLVKGKDASTQMKSIKQRLRDSYYGTNYQDDQSLPYSDRVRSIIHTSDNDTELLTNTLGFWSDLDITKIVNNARRVKDGA